MLPPSLQDSLPAGWLAFAGRASTLWIATKGFRSHSHPPFLDLSWRKGSFILNLPLASHHSITSSARTSSVGGTSKPSDFAVLRLRTVSYFVGIWTGRSAGFAPRSIRSTYVAA